MLRLVMVIVALPLPEPLQPPELVICTANPEFAVAATGKLLLATAVDGAAIVTVMICPKRLDVVVTLVTIGAAGYVELPAWV